MNKYKWYHIYEKLAQLLVEFYNKCIDNSSLPGEEFYKLCTFGKNEKDFNRLFGWSKNIKENSIDPFHIYASFNNSGTTLDKKIERIEFYFNVLGKVDKFRDMVKYGDEVDNRFSAPHIAIINVIADRTKKSQNEIWDFFYSAYHNDRIGLKNGFDIFKQNWYGIGFTVMTEFLFWINSSNYLSLDKNTEYLLKSSRYRIHKTFQGYFNLINEIKKNSNLDKDIFRLLVKYSYIKIKPENLRESEEIDLVLNKYIVGNNDPIVNEFIKFQVIGIKILSKCNPKYKKTLEKNIYYKFNNKFVIEEKVNQIHKIVYKKNHEHNLFDIGLLKINIGVIVGKNGSGKSTLAELAFMGINNLVKYLYKNKSNYKDSIEYIKDDLNLQLLYTINNYIYQITIDNNLINVEQYYQTRIIENEIIFEKNNIYRQSDFNFEDLYYTEHLNYSLHSLNQNYFGDWLYNLFHKNDGYKTPITLEPQRNYGNIDINRQINLTKDRLLINLLDNNWDVKQNILKDKIVKNLEFKIDISKIIRYTLPIKEVFENLVEAINNRYNLHLDMYSYKHYSNIFNEMQSHSIIDSAERYEELEEILKTIKIEFLLVIYLFNKFKVIVKDYVNYKEFEEDIKKGIFVNILEYIDKKLDHTTFKIFRVIYYFKYHNDSFNKYSFNIEPLDFGSKIVNLKVNNNKLITDMLIPPSIFKMDIEFENGPTFENLSSGEKQKIFTITTILYHIKNIASIEDGYKNINVVLDEIELYFHPEMQKDFISDLLSVISTDEYIKSNISFLNFSFITHSPFVLSDVTYNDVIALDGDGKQVKEIGYCFASNIYDLLNSNFFMKSFMGRFAETKIDQVIAIINIYKLIRNNLNVDLNIDLQTKYKEFYNIEKKESLNEIKNRIEASSRKLLEIIEYIGEPVLRNKLLNEMNIILSKVDDKKINEILDSLKGKNYIQINEIISKLNKSTKKIIINKFFENM